MLPKVLLFSGLVVATAAYPLVFGPVDFSIDSAKQADARQADALPPVLARAETDVPRGTVVLQSDQRGHFFGEFRLNGRRTEAMVDTGATVVAINRSMASRAGITLRPSDFTSQVGTANGMVAGAPVVLESVQIGRIRIDNVHAVVLEDKALPQALIGMSFLSKLKRFEVRGGDMVLDR